MSDVSVRDAARRFAASGAVDDEARLLRERVRAGRLKLERLRLCAYLGHKAARRALGDPLAATFSLVRLRVEGIRGGWKRHIRSAPTRALALALVTTIDAACAVALGRGTGHPSPPVADIVALSALRAWSLDAGAERGTLSAVRVRVRRSRFSWSHLTHATRCALDVALEPAHRKHQHAAATLLAAGALARRWRPLEQTFTRTLIDALLA